MNAISPIVFGPQLGRRPRLLDLDIASLRFLYSAATRFTDTLTVSGVDVSAWRSLGRGRSMLQATGTKQPDLNASGYVKFDGSDDFMQQPAWAAQSATFIRGTTLPDASGSLATKGFTCTGIARAPDGTWWLGNDGREDVADLTYAPSLVHLSADFATKLGEILLMPLFPSILTVQGVAYDTSDDTLWFCSTDESKVRHVSLAGADISSISPGYKPNGLAYDPVLDAVIVGRFAGEASERRIEWLDADDGALVKGVTLTDQPDHLWFDPSDGPQGTLWFSYGSNNAAGSIGIFNVGPAVDNTSERYSLPEADCIEGIFKLGSTLYVLNDGYTHAGSPALNRVLEFRLPDPAYQETLGSKFLLFAVARLPSSLGATARAIVVVGDPTGAGSAGGVGLYFTASSTAQLTFIACTSTDTAANQNTATIAVTTTTKFLIMAVVDFIANTAVFYINGAQVGSAADMSKPGDGGLRTLRATLGAADQSTISRFTNGEVYAAGASVNITDAERQKLEGYLAGWHGVTLAAGHPYVAGPPS